MYQAPQLSLELEKPKLLKTYPSFLEISGTIHSAVSYDIDKYLFLFDERNMYVITNSRPPKCQVHQNIYCIGVQNFTKSYNYALCQDKIGCENPGLRLLDMESVIKTEKCNMILAKKVDVGAIGSFEWSPEIEKIGMVRSLSDIVVFPILH